MRLRWHFGQILPWEYWREYNPLLVTHGRRTCAPLSPWCGRCPVYDLCERVGRLPGRGERGGRLTAERRPGGIAIFGAALRPVTSDVRTVRLRSTGLTAHPNLIDSSMPSSTRSGIEYHHDRCRKFRWVRYPFSEELSRLALSSRYYIAKEGDNANQALAPGLHLRLFTSD